MSEKQPSVLISILNWNGLKDTMHCLSSVSKISYDNFKIVVIDNGSDENPSDLIKKNFPNIEVKRLETNTGFAGGHNISLSRAMLSGFDYVWLLNNDAQVEDRTLSELVSTAESNPEIALCGPTIMYLDQPEKIQNCASYIDWESFSIRNTNNLETAIEWESSRPSEILVWGTAILIRVEYLKNIGLFDEKFFAYYEDTDLSVRSLRAGYLNKTVLGAKVYHYSPQNNRYRAFHYHYLMARNEFIFWNKHITPKKRLNWLMYYVANTLLYADSFSDFELKDNTKAVLAGLWDGFMKRTGGYEFNKRAMPRLLVKLVLFRPRTLANIITSIRIRI